MASFRTTFVHFCARIHMCHLYTISSCLWCETLPLALVQACFHSYREFGCNRKQRLTMESAFVFAKRCCAALTVRTASNHSSVGRISEGNRPLADSLPELKLCEFGLWFVSLLTSSRHCVFLFWLSFLIFLDAEWGQEQIVFPSESDSEGCICNYSAVWFCLIYNPDMCWAVGSPNNSCFQTWTGKILGMALRVTPPVLYV